MEHKLGEPRIIPEFPKSNRFTLIALVRGPGPKGKAHTHCFCVANPDEMDHIMNNHRGRILWFTVACHLITNEMIGKLLTEQEYLS